MAWFISLHLLQGGLHSYLPLLEQICLQQYEPLSRQNHHRLLAACDFADRFLEQLCSFVFAVIRLGLVWLPRAELQRLNQHGILVHEKSRTRIATFEGSKVSMGTDRPHKVRKFMPLLSWTCATRASCFLQGVLLCERPSNVDFALPAFKPSAASSALEPLGLSTARKVTIPCHDNTFPWLPDNTWLQDHVGQAEVGPSITEAHKLFVQQLGGMQRQLQDQKRIKESSEQSKRDALAADMSKVRAAILGRGNGESVISLGWKAATGLPAGMRVPDKKMLDDVDEFVDKIVMEASAAAAMPGPSTDADAPAPEQCVTSTSEDRPTVRAPT